MQTSFVFVKLCFGLLQTCCTFGTQASCIVSEMQLDLLVKSNALGGEADTSNPGVFY